MKSNFFKETQTLMFSCEFCGSCKIRRKSVRSYFFQNGNIKNNFKIRESKKKKKETNKKNVYVMFYYEIHWFYQDFKSENQCFLNLYSVHVARIVNLRSS